MLDENSIRLAVDGSLQAGCIRLQQWGGQAPYDRTMRLRVLGEVDVVADGDPVRVGSRSQRVVLAVLASQPGFSASADLLVDVLWGDDPPATARATLRTYVSRLRRLLGGCLTIGPTGYALDLACDELDACLFEHLVDRAAEAAARSDPHAAVALLDDALALCRGAPFGDVADAEPVRPVVARLDECRTTACEARAAALLAAGRAAEAVGVAEELVAQHPLREGAWTVLIEALAAASRASEALRAFQRSAQALAEAGLEPSERLRRAESVALAHQQPEIHPRRLAVSASSLVGRAGDVAAVVGLLTNQRIVTLVGPGGVGKTRLALAAAAEVSDRFEWGARLVELAGVADSKAVPAVVTQGLGLAAHAETAEEVLANAGQLDMLGVLDNCEHVVDAAANAVELLATGGARMRVLATSREPLGVEGEQLWPVPPLPTGITLSAQDAVTVGAAPPTDAPAHQTTWSPAHELFLERARGVRPDLDPDAGEREAIDTITRRLDGLPLAIEMAATRIATMPLMELATRIGDEVGVVVSRRRAAEPRHRTLGAVVEWSERLLDDAERALFADMAIFEDAVRPDDVAAVTGCADALDVLSRLAERSLLVVDVSGDQARFRMLHTIRDSARRLLAGSGRSGELSARHAEHVAATLAQANLDLRGMREPEAHARIEDLLVEARAAHTWAAQHNPALAQRLCGALFLFGQSRCRDEVLGWSDSLVSQLDRVVDGPSGALVLVAAAQRAVNRGDVATAMSLAEHAVGVASDTPGASGAEAQAYEIVSDIHMFSGRLADAAQAARSELAAARRAGDPHCLTGSFLNMAISVAYGGDYEQAERLLAEAPDDEGFAPSDKAWLRYGRGEVILDRDPPRALAALDEAIVLSDSVGNRYVGGVARVSATSLRARADDPEAALGPFAAVINHWRGQGNGPLQATTLRNLVVLFHRLGAAPEVAQLLGSTQRGAVAPTFGDEARRLDEAREWATAQLGDTEAAHQVAVGGARGLEEAAIAALGWIAVR